MIVRQIIILCCFNDQSNLVVDGVLDVDLSQHVGKKIIIM